MIAVAWVCPLFTFDFTGYLKRNTPDTVPVAGLYAAKGDRHDSLFLSRT